MIEIDSFFFSPEEREQACAWIDGSGYRPTTVRGGFQVSPALPGSWRLDFEQYRYDEHGKMILDASGDRVEADPFVIYTSDRLGWLQHYLVRTGRTVE